MGEAVAMVGGASLESVSKDNIVPLRLNTGTFKSTISTADGGRGNRGSGVKEICTVSDDPSCSVELPSTRPGTLD